MSVNTHRSQAGMTTGPVDLTSPASVMQRLADIENGMAERQNGYEAIARRWHEAQRDINKAKAWALLTADDKTVTEKKARGEVAAFDVEGAECEAEYEATKAAMRTLESRATILMSVLKAQGRA